MVNIQNYDIYNERMAKGMEDKLFFLDYLAPYVSTIIDFGCADAALGKELDKRGLLLKAYANAGYYYYGIDTDFEMRINAEKALGDRFYISLDQLDRSRPHLNWEHAAVVFSSVVHEIVHYSDKGLDELKSILQFLRDKKVKQIIIRDMAVKSKAYDICVDVPPMIAHHPVWENYIAARGFDNEPITERVLAEFLLKYRYIENWARERDENYFPGPMEGLDSIYRNYFGDYELTYADHTIHRYTAANVKYDWGIELKTPTHYKRIFTRI